jgi:Fur family iron response transcriptional regulator
MKGMSVLRPYAPVLDRLRGVGLRPTRQRLALAKMLFDKGHCHVTAEELHRQAREANVRVSLATVYNTLHQFTDNGLLREVIVDSGRSYFDTNTSEHHHFLHEESGRLEDIPTDSVRVINLPEPPAGTTVKRVDLVVRLTKK